MPFPFSRRPNRLAGSSLNLPSPRLRNTLVAESPSPIETMSSFPSPSTSMMQIPASPLFPAPNSSGTNFTGIIGPTLGSFEMLARLVSLARALQRASHAELRRRVQWIDLQRLLKCRDGLRVILLLTVEGAEKVVGVRI